MDDKPKITVIYQDTKIPGPGLGTVLVELLFFIFLIGVGAVVAGFFGKW